MKPEPTRSGLETVMLTRRTFLGRATVATIAVAAGSFLASRTAGAAETTDSALVKVQGEFLLGPSSHGIDPATEPVALRLLVPPGDRVYPGAIDFMPIVGFMPTTDGWTISSAEKARTGLQSFEIKRTADPGRFTFTLVDTRTSVVAGRYDVVWVELTIGNDAGECDETLVERNGNWTLS